MAVKIEDLNEVRDTIHAEHASVSPTSETDKTPVLQMDGVSFTYANGRENAGVRDVELHVDAGEVVLLCGPSGCGKTTVTRLANGLAPQYHEGTVRGAVTVEGLDVSSAPLHRTARAVGSVFQNPKTQFFNVDVRSEIAFGCENQGMERSEIAARVEHVTRSFELDELTERSLFDLSGGQKQRVACASATAADPRLIVLDEPSSNLDFPSITQLRHAIERWKSEGKAILVSEHRLHYLADLVDRAYYLNDGAVERVMTGQVLRTLSQSEIAGLGLRPVRFHNVFHQALGQAQGSPGAAGTTHAETPERITLEGFSFAYKRGFRIHRALDIGQATFPRRGITAVIGNNGAGKSTLAQALVGLNRCKGKLAMDGRILGRHSRSASCFMVMQDVNHQLFAESVLDEILLSMADPDEVEAMRLLEELDLAEHASDHPLALSGGQRQRVCIASALASGRDLVVYDEPTSGLDRAHMRQVAHLVQEVRQRGAAQVIVTHDPELILACCTEVIRLEAGRITESYALDGKDDAGARRLERFFTSSLTDHGISGQ